jgi:hypothetical protein
MPLDVAIVVVATSDGRTACAQQPALWWRRVTVAPRAPSQQPAAQPHWAIFLEKKGGNRTLPRADAIFILNDILYMRAAAAGAG